MKNKLKEFFRYGLRSGQDLVMGQGLHHWAMPWRLSVAAVAAAAVAGGGDMHKKSHFSF